MYMKLSVLGLWDDPESKGTWLATECEDEFDAWNPHGGRRQPSPASCPLTSICTSWHSYAHIYACTNTHMCVVSTHVFYMHACVVCSICTYVCCVCAYAWYICEFVNGICTQYMHACVCCINKCGFVVYVCTVHVCCICIYMYVIYMWYMCVLYVHMYACVPVYGVVICVCMGVLVHAHVCRSYGRLLGIFLSLSTLFLRERVSHWA